MRLSEKWARLSQTGPMRTFLVGLGFLLIALTPFVGPIPGPGGIIVFGMSEPGNVTRALQGEKIGTLVTSD